jgi:pimeloyl-ACP methyl ester carboxylesterase
MILKSASVAALLLMNLVQQLPTSFWQVTPEYKVDPTPTAEHSRAVLLIHGLVPHPIASSKARIPEANSWQLPKSELVRQLKPDFDVFGLSYAQIMPCEWVCHSEGLRSAIKTLKTAGYSEIIVIGHSAGGLIARHFVEQYPDAGVTKVICVASPHQGSFWANLPQIGLPSTQIPFIKSLAPQYRTSDKFAKQTWPKHVQFCCVICQLPRLKSDSVVSIESQWPEDLQKQGIPASVIRVNHFEAIRTPEASKVISELAREKLRRWSPEEVDQGRKSLLKEPEKPGSQASRKRDR